MIVAVLSDIHSNLQALDAVLDSLGTVDSVWHLGDVVGYGPEPDAVVERLRALGAIGVKGNHDVAACGGSCIDEFNPLARKAAEWTRDRMSAATRSALESLPERLTPEGTPFTLVHGSPRDPILEYVDSDEIAAQNLCAFETPYCLVGHTHVPLVLREMARHAGRIQMLAPDAGTIIHLDERRALINPGSVGQPRDGNPRASWIILDTEKATAVWQRAAYDIRTTQIAIVAAGLPAPLSRRLSRGE